MHGLKKGSISLLELIVLIIIAIEAIFFVTYSFNWYDSKFSSGNDSLYLNTCESVAKVNSLNGVDCPVNDCVDPSGKCVHYTTSGYIGYFDSETNKIVGNKPSGYNSSDNPSIDGKGYTGKKGSMVNRVRCFSGNIYLDWVKGND